MADATRAKPAPAAAPPPEAELDARVTALLDEMQQASDRVIRHLDRTEPGGQPASQIPPDAMAADDLGRAVDQMIADAKSARHPSREIAALDQALAHRGDDLIEGEITEEAEVLAVAPLSSPTNVESAAPSMPYTPRMNVPAPPPSPFPQPPPPPAPAAQAAASHNPQAAPLPVQVAVEASEPPEPVVDVGNHDGPTVAASVLRVLAAASGPLTRRPHLRPWVGYLAVWTLFNAACLLGYNFFMREPVAPSPRAPGANSADSARASDSPGADSASDGHGGATKPDPGKTAKATPKPRTRSALPKKDAHGGGH